MITQEIKIRNNEPRSREYPPADIQGKNVLTYDSKNCVVNVPKNKLVVLQGMEDMIVVENDGILLVCKQKDEQQIKRIVNDVKATKGDKYV